MRKLCADDRSPYVAELVRDAASSTTRAAWRSSSASSACSGCTSRATAAPGMAPSTYGLACQELEAVDSGIRSLVSVQGSLAMYAIYATAARSRSRSGCPAWRPARRSAASASPSPTTAPTPPACARAPPRRRRLGARRPQDVDHQRLDRRRRRRVGAGPTSGIRGFVVPTDIDGLLRATRSSTSCRCAPRSPASSSSTTSGSPPTRCCPTCAGLRGPLSLPQRGALRDRLGRAGRRPVVATRPRWTTPTSAPSSASRSRLPAHPAEARRHGRRARQGPAARAAPRSAQGRRHAAARAGQPRQAQQRPRGAGDLPRPPGRSSAPTGSRWSTP